MAASKHPVFLVDDDTKHLLLLKEHLETHCRYNLDVHLFSSGENCLQRLGENPDIVILDYYLDAIRPDAKNGLEILKQISERAPSTDVVMMSSQDDIQVAMHTLEYGAYDYIIKGESAYIRAQLMVDHLLEHRYREAWQHTQKVRMRTMYALSVILLLLLVATSYFALRR